MVLPVRQSDIYGGLAEISGLVRLKDETLIIEYQVQDELFGMLQSDVKNVKLPLGMIDSVEVEKRWFRHRFQIYLNQLPNTEKPLTIEGNCLSFLIKKADKERALSLRSRLMMQVSEQKLKNLDMELNQDTELNEKKENAKPGYEKIEIDDTEEAESRLKNILRNNPPDSSKDG